MRSRHLLGVLAIGAPRVEARLEQRDHQARDLRVRHQRLLHVPVAERDARLAQVLADRPQHGDLAPGECGAEDEAVVAVVLHLAAPGAHERVLEAVADAAGIEIARSRVGQAEVVDPDPVGAVRDDRVRALVRNLHAHVLEQRQHVGEGEGAAGPEQLRAQHARPGLERAVEADAESLVPWELLDVHDVRERGAGHPVGPVGGWKSLRVTAKQLGAALLAELLDERLLEVVGPGARGRHEHHLDLACVEFRHLAGFHVRDEMQAYHDGLGHARRVVDARGAGGVSQDRLDAAPVLRVEAVARHEHEHREEAPKRVAPCEQPQSLALAEVKDPHRHLEQLVRRDLEQLVARIRVEDLEQRLLVVAAVREARALEHRGDPAPQDRDLGRGRAVGRVRVEPEEATLPGHVPVRSRSASRPRSRDTTAGARSRASSPSSG